MIKMSLSEFNKIKNSKNIQITEIINKKQPNINLNEKIENKHKYNAQTKEIDNIKFSSKKEAKYYLTLKLLKQSGELLYFLRQVPFDLPGNIKYRVDFMEVWKNGEIKYVDVKGYKTKEYIIKKKIVESLYPIKIIEI
jgi:hypothetical protein